MNYDKLTKEQLLGIHKDTLEYLNEQEQEIERLKEQLSDEIDEELKQSEIMVKKQQEIERLNNIIEKIDEFISYKIIIEANAKGYQITLKDLTDIKKK